MFGTSMIFLVFIIGGFIACAAATETTELTTEEVPANNNNMNFADIGKIIRDHARRNEAAKQQLQQANIRSLLSANSSKALNEKVDGAYLVREIMGMQDKFPSLGVSMMCNAAMLQLFGPIMNISSLDPAAILALLGKPVGKG